MGYLEFNESKNQERFSAKDMSALRP